MQRPLCTGQDGGKKLNRNQIYSGMSHPACKETSQEHTVLQKDGPHLVPCLLCKGCSMRLPAPNDGCSMQEGMRDRSCREMPTQLLNSRLGFSWSHLWSPSCVQINFSRAHPGPRQLLLGGGWRMAPCTSAQSPALLFCSFPCQMPALFSFFLLPMLCFAA